MPASGLGLTFASYSPDAVLTTTMEILTEDSLRQQIFDGIAAFQIFFNKPQTGLDIDTLERYGMLEKVSGGSSIDIPVLYQASTTFKRYQRYGQIPLTPQEGIGRVFVDWSQAAMSITISGFEERVNKGNKTQLVNLIRAKTDQMTMTFSDNLGSDVYAGGSQNPAAANGMHGITYYVDKDPTTGTVAAVNRATNSWWRNKFNGTGGTFTDTAPSMAKDGKRRMFQMLLACSRSSGLGEPDFILTGETEYQNYWLTLEPQERYVNTNSGDPTFKDALTFKRKPIYWDRKCVSGEMYFLNSRTWKLYVHEDAFFASLGFQQPSNQDARSALQILQHQLVCSEPRSNGVISGWVA